MFRLLFRPQTIARKQVVQHLQHQSMYRRLFATDSKSGQINAGGKQDSAAKNHPCDHISGNDKRVVDPGKESKGNGIDILKAIGDLSARVDTGFAKVETRFAGIDVKFAGIDAKFVGIDAKFVGIDARFAGIDARFAEIDARFVKIMAEMVARFALVETRFAGVETRFAKAETGFNRLERKITFMQWQIGFMISIAVAIFSVARYAVKGIFDKYLSQAINGVLDGLESALVGPAEKKTAP